MSDDLKDRVRAIETTVAGLESQGNAHDRRLTRLEIGAKTDNERIGDLVREFSLLSEQMKRERQWLMDNLSCQSRLLRQVLRGSFTDEQIARIERGDEGHG